jgi:hypothetical protein
MKINISFFISAFSLHPSYFSLPWLRGEILQSKILNRQSKNAPRKRGG